MLILENEFKCEYCINEKDWIAFGNVLDGKLLSTKVAGGYVGAYLGLYTYAKTPAKAQFDWVEYKKIEKEN
jgi:alpha-N-arabinofuranosidase